MCRAMSAIKYRLTYRLVTFLLVLLPFATGRPGVLFLKNGGGTAEFRVLASPSTLSDVPPGSTLEQYTRNHVQRSTLKPVGLHRLAFLALGGKVSSPTESAAGSSAAVAIQCTLHFDGPVDQPPTVTMGPSTHPAGSHLTILRDTATEARGWIHGYQRGVRPLSKFRFGASSAGDGEYVQVHPPSGEHTYDLLVFDADYAPGPKMSALTGTPWHNPERALGAENALVKDIQAGNPRSSPHIIGRCSTTVSHDQAAPAEEDM